MVLDGIPPTIPDGLSEEEREAFLRGTALATHMRETSAGCYLHGSCHSMLSRTMDPNACFLYMEGVLTDAGTGSDPVQQMLLEQLILAHHNVGRLHVKAAQATTTEEANSHNASAARLLGEFRRLALALREYRTQLPVKQVTVVNQQNVTTGEQQIAYVNGSEGREAGKSAPPENELGSKGSITHAQDANIIPQSASGGSRQKEPVEAKRPDRGGTGDAASGGDPKSPVATFDGPQNGGGKSEGSGQRQRSPK